MRPPKQSAADDQKPRAETQHFLERAEKRLHFRQALVCSADSRHSSDDLGVLRASDKAHKRRLFRGLVLIPRADIKPGAGFGCKSASAVGVMSAIYVLLSRRNWISDMISNMTNSTTVWAAA